VFPYQDQSERLDEEGRLRLSTCWCESLSNILQELIAVISFTARDRQLGKARETANLQPGEQVAASETHLVRGGRSNYPCCTGKLFKRALVFTSADSGHRQER
jgi:hypothetical protein